MNSRNPALGAYLLLSVCELLCKLLCKLFFYVRLATFCMSDSQTSDSCMSEGPPIERWRNTCVAISSKLQEIFRPGYKKWPSDRNRNIYQEFLLPPSLLPLKPQLSCCGFREWHHLSCFPVFVLFPANIFCLFLSRHNSSLQQRENLIRILHCLP